jgi:hypothetical protein
MAFFVVMTVAIPVTAISIAVVAVIAIAAMVSRIVNRSIVLVPIADGDGHRNAGGKHERRSSYGDGSIHENAPLPDVHSP